MTKEEIAERSNIKGVWFEEDYRRVYPLNSTASHLVGFTYTETARTGESKVIIQYSERS